jgi:hypothetical protein
MDFRRLNVGELVGFVGAGVLALSLFLPWFATSCERRGVPPGCNQFSRYHGQFGDFNAWQTFAVLDWLLLAACAAPFILAWIIIRGHELTWRPGEVTMIVGMVAFALIVLNGIILGRPGDTVDMKIKYGYVIALLGALGITGGGLIRQAVGGRVRKPPGTV